MIYIEDIESEEDLLKYFNYGIALVRFEMNREHILMDILEGYCFEHIIDEEKIYHYTVIHRNMSFYDIEESYYKYKHADIVCEIGKGE